MGVEAAVNVSSKHSCQCECVRVCVLCVCIHLQHSSPCKDRSRTELDGDAGNDFPFLAEVHVHHLALEQGLLPDGNLTVGTERDGNSLGLVPGEEGGVGGRDGEEVREVHTLKGVQTETVCIWGGEREEGSKRETNHLTVPDNKRMTTHYSTQNQVIFTCMPDYW